jgi:hypothetical protein
MLIRSSLQTYGSYPKIMLPSIIGKDDSFAFPKYLSAPFETCSMRRSFYPIGEMPLSCHYEYTGDVQDPSAHILGAESKRAFLLPHRQLHLPFILSLKIHNYMMVCCYKAILACQELQRSLSSASSVREHFHTCSPEVYSIISTCNVADNVKTLRRIS